MYEKTNQQNAATILNNLHDITVAILNRYDFGETNDLKGFANIYCEKYIEVYNEVETTYSSIRSQKVKINATFASKTE